MRDLRDGSRLLEDARRWRGPLAAEDSGVAVSGCQGEEHS